MDSGCDEKRKSVDDDRLSSLPDDLIHKIFKLFDMKQVIKISVLSSRWRFIWTSMPYLNFSIEDSSSLMPPYLDSSSEESSSRTLYKSIGFVNRVLSRRNNQKQVSSLKLILHVKVSATFVERVINYAFSHNVKSVNITCYPKGCTTGDPLSVLSSPCLKYLRLSGASYTHPLTVESTWEFSALTTLYLECMTLYDSSSEKCVSLFSECTNLKNLTLNHFSIKGSADGLSICPPRLSNLTLQNGDWGSKIVKVVAPQLKNLTIVECTGTYLLSTPHLATLFFKGYSPRHFSADGCPSLETVRLSIYNLDKLDAPKIIGLLQHFHNVKYLELAMNIIQLLSLSKDLISNQPSPFANLEKLKIVPVSGMPLPIEVNNYLLGGIAPSPGATCSINGLP